MLRRIAPSKLPAAAACLLVAALALPTPAPARIDLTRYPTDLYTEARTAALEGRLERAEELWQKMLADLEGPLYAVDLATACGAEPTREILDKLRAVHPVFSVRETDAEGTVCRRILFGLFPAEEGMDPLVKHLPPVSLYPPTVVRLEDYGSSSVSLSEIRRLNVQPEGATTAVAQSEPDLSEADRTRAESLFAEGNRALAEKDLDRAESAFQSVLEIQPDNVSAMHNLGIVQMFQEDFDVGIALFEQTIATDPTYLKAYLNLATAYFGKGESESALNVLGRALALAPDNFEVRYTLAAVSAETQDFAAAHEHLAAALEIQPNDPRARALSLALPPVDQLADAGTTPTPEPAAPDTDSNEGSAGMATSASTNLRTRLREPTLQIRPGAQPPRPETTTTPSLPPEQTRREVDERAQAHFARGSQAFEVGQLRQAEREFSLAAEIDPANPNIHNNLGAVYMDQSRWASAADAFRRALAADPEHVKARINLGGVLYNMGQTSEAVQILKEAEALAPRDPEVLYALALLQAHSGEREAAQGYIQRAVQEAPFNPKMRSLQEALLSGDERMYVAEPEIFLRDDPDRNASVVGKIQYGAALQILQRRSGWVRVRVADQGIEGWVVDGMLMSSAPAS